MANPKIILQMAIGKREEKHEEMEPAINELVERVFTTRNLVHFAHWSTQSLAQHLALGELYDAIVDDTDEIVECYQGEYECLLEGLELPCTKATSDVYGIIKADADWVRANRTAISKGSGTIENLLDTLTGHYNKVLYKLKNLK